MRVLRATELSRQDACLLGISQEGGAEEDYETEETNDIYALVQEAARDAFDSLSLSFDRRVQPWEEVCIEAAQELASALPPVIEKDFVWYSGDDTSDDHVFLVITYEGNKWLVDPTYQQFLSLDDRFNMQIVMFCELTDKESLIDCLNEYQIVPELYKVWSKPLIEMSFIN